MTPERWKQIGSLLQSALECDPSERAAFLKDASGDDEALRQKVESLLASQSDTCFLEDPAVVNASPMFDDLIQDMFHGGSIGSPIWR
jgi:hypothetical protein